MTDNSFYTNLARRIVAARYPGEPVTPELMFKHAQKLGAAPSDEDLKIAKEEAERTARLEKVTGSLPIASPPIPWAGVAAVTPGETLRLDDVANLLLGNAGKTLLKTFVNNHQKALTQVSRWLKHSHSGLHRDHLAKALIATTKAPVDESLLEYFGMLEELFGNPDVSVPDSLKNLDPAVVAVATSKSFPKA